MTPEEALALAKTISDIYGQASTALIQSIAKAAARGVTKDRAELAEVLRLRGEAQGILLQLRSASRDQVPALLARVYAAQAGVHVNPRPVAALAEDTVRILDGTTPRILRWTEDIYRRVAAEALGPAVTGSVLRRDAAAVMVDRLTKHGVTAFTDSAGRVWQLDSYAEMATRTALGRAHLAGTLNQYAQQGREYVIISDSPEECPQCRPFEGAVLALGADTPPSDAGGLRYEGTLNSAIGRGLFHPNCTHRANAYIPGLTKPFDDTENPEGYALRQRQRELERRVRESKRRVAGLRPLGDTPTLRLQEHLLGGRQRQLKDFVRDNDRKKWVSDQRSRIPGGLPPKPPRRPPSGGPRTPDGSPVSAALTPTGGTRAFRGDVQHALDVIDQVHSDGALPPLQIHPTTGASLGRYERTARDSLAMRIKPDGDWPQLTTVHEVGHFLDHQAIGARGGMNSEDTGGLLAGVLGAADRSRAVQALRNPQPLTGLTSSQQAAVAEHLDYLLRRRETWARIYAQWVAVRSGDRNLLEQLANNRDHGRRQGIMRHWDDDDFAPIADEVDDLMRRLGWRT